VGRPKQFDPDKAVDEAVEVFWHKGYAATTPQDLVAGLGIGKGSLYNTFGSKQALFEQALRRYGDQRTAALADLLNEPGPVKPLLARALRRLTGADPGRPLGKGCLAVSTAATADDTVITKDMFDRMEVLLRQAVERGLSTGELSTDDPGRAASLLLSTIISLNVLAKASDTSERMPRIIDAVLATL
jgi:TetR/AcrR family transcriptional repressor of nem operon